MINVCMECGYEWEQETQSCPRCGCLNFDTQIVEEEESGE